VKTLGPLIQAAVKNKYGFNMEVSVPAMAARNRGHRRVDHSVSRGCDTQIDQGVTPGSQVALRGGGGQSPAQAACLT
jgi:hypothetical protein